jgi:hypothetical protein
MNDESISYFTGLEHFQKTVAIRLPYSYFADDGNGQHWAMATNKFYHILWKGNIKQIIK